MRSIRFAVILAVAAFLFVLNPAGTSDATPGLGGMPVFSVRTSAPGAADITALIGAGPAFLTCTSADILAPPLGGVGPCPARVPPALLNPTAMTNPISTSLNLGGPFTDDLDGLSFRETVGLASDFDFSVSAAPPNVFPPFVPAPGTVGVACGPAPTVFSQAAALEAQGDIFTTAGAPAACNVQAPGCPGIVLCDEATLGLIAPDPAYPPVPPLDDIDALAEFTGAPGPCTYGGSVPIPTVCPAMTVAAGSLILPGIAPAPAACLGGPPADAGSILVPPGTLASPPCLPAGCPGAGPPAGPPPCIAVPGIALGLVFGGDDMDALCWFDINGNMVPDLPMSVAGPAGDMYMFSLAPGSASVVGAPFFSAADILGTRGLVFAPTVIRTAASLGLLPTDNVDGLICHQMDGDADLIPNALDNCPTNANGTQADLDMDGLGDACDTDDDGDGVEDSAEGPCDSDPMDAGKRPERLDLAGDDDGDLAFNEALPSPASDLFDCDGDGWTGAQEMAIYAAGTTANDQDSCGNNGWPADLDPNNTLSIGDFNSFIFPNGLDDGHGVFAYYAHTVPDAGRLSEERWNLASMGASAIVIDIGDINALSPGVSAPTSRPPMFNGQPAFFAGACPWPP
ncbi:MAG: thrombospondin type 3 repeat-containing protein [Dehalococcoidia bacterium]|nr:thrombospondin type 3 repeat-containing protein [Dehalococcoidia bacterium]